MPTASNTFPSSAIAGALGAGTYAIADITSRGIEEWRQSLPDVRVVRNLVSATSTLTEGLLYLLAFIFLISGVGLFMLGVQTTMRSSSTPSTPTSLPHAHDVGDTDIDERM